MRRRMKTIFEHIKKSYSAGKFKGMGMALVDRSILPFLYRSGPGSTAYHPIHRDCRHPPVTTCCCTSSQAAIYVPHHPGHPHILDGFGCPAIIMGIGGCQDTGQGPGGIEEDGKTLTRC